jgi:putative endopeptidase
MENQQKRKPAPMNTPPRRLRYRSRPFSVTAALVIGLSAFAIPASAIDSTAIDSSVSPRNDFVKYAWGAWAKNAKIAPDRSAVGAFSEVNDVLQARITESLKSNPSTASGQKVATLFAQGMDIEARNQSGRKPIQNDLNKIRTAKSLSALTKRLVEQARLYGPISLEVSPSFTDPTKTSLLAWSGSLGLPDRVLYLGEDPQSKQLHDAYTQHLAVELELAGYTKKNAAASAKGVFAFEKKIAKLKTDITVLFQDFSVLKPTKVSALVKQFPLVNWTAILAGTPIEPDTEVTVVDFEYVKNADRLFRATPLSTVKAYYTSQLVNNASPFLDERFAAAQFDFAGKILAGAQTQEPLAETVTSSVGALLPAAVGELYVQKHFSPEAKTEITRITADILAAFRKRLESASWMTQTTKTRALEKLSKMKVRVGYPDRWESYDDITMGESYFDSVRAISRATALRQLKRVNQPVDNANWGPVGEVNASYNPLNNSITFPAGILSGSFFDLNNDPASNYGSIGAVIGHEITHAFDPAGSQFDGDGRLESWWTETDATQFASLNQRVAAQFSAIKTPAGPVDGEKTLGENVADMGGVQVAFDALQDRLASQAPVPAVNGLTQQQVFFVAFAQSWKSLARPEREAQLLAIDEHAPDAVRAIQPLRNMASFHDTFKIVEGDPMWLAPADRVTVW